MVVLVTGGSGQLGQAFQSIINQYPQSEFHFVDADVCDITSIAIVRSTFEKYKPDFCVNAAAYTAVDKAESDQELAVAINVDGARNLAIVSKEFDTILIHISTDFVFDGEKSSPYSETDTPNPKGVYGQTKLDGEREIEAHWHKHFIIRTSWLYSAFANNFMKTMLRLASDRTELSVVNDQIGTPTNAVDLANAIMKIIQSVATQSRTNLQPRINNLQPTTTNFGTYHFSNLGECSWYDFAKKIFEINSVVINLKPIPTSAFPTSAQRPKYSVLDKSKIIENFRVEVKSWEESLESISL